MSQNPEIFDLLTREYCTVMIKQIDSG